MLSIDGRVPFPTPTTKKKLIDRQNPSPHEHKKLYQNTQTLKSKNAKMKCPPWAQCQGEDKGVGVYIDKE